MKRVIILGHGAAGKSTLARPSGNITGLPVIELDQEFFVTGEILCHHSRCGETSCPVTRERRIDERICGSSHRWHIAIQ